MNAVSGPIRWVTSSPSTQATFRPVSPSSRAMSTTSNAAARGLATPMLVTILVPLAWQCASTPRIRARNCGL